MLQEIVDPDLGYTLKEVNAMNEVIRDNIEACEQIPDYEETKAADGAYDHHAFDAQV